MFQPLINWYKGGRKQKDRPQVGEDYWACLWVFDPDQGALWFKNPMTNPYPEVLNFPNAMGSGATYALGAMYAGADLVKAVEIASKLDIYTGGEIQLIDIPVRPPKQSKWKRVWDALRGSGNQG